jgi:hypothetical protein
VSARGIAVIGQVDTRVCPYKNYKKNPREFNLIPKGALMGSLFYTHLLLIQIASIYAQLSIYIDIYRFTLLMLSGRRFPMTYDFDALIRNDRESRKEKAFAATFLEYLHIVQENPQVPALSHERMYNIIMQSGLEIIKTEDYPRLRRIYGNDTIRKYKFFEDDFYGIE